MKPKNPPYRKISLSLPPDDDDDQKIPTNHASHNPVSLLTLALSSFIAAGVQFGWALQLSLLTPYIQVRPNSSFARLDLISFLVFTTNVDVFEQVSPKSPKCFHYLLRKMHLFVNLLSDIVMLSSWSEIWIFSRTSGKKVRWLLIRNGNTCYDLLWYIWKFLFYFCCKILTAI